MKRFSDFASDERPFDGSKLKIDDVLNKEILIIGYKITDSRYGKSNAPNCLKLHFKLDNDRYILFTGSSVLCDQIEKYKNEIPFAATIKKIDKYYSFA